MKGFHGLGTCLHCAFLIALGAVLEVIIIVLL